MKSDIADLKNTGGRPAGTLTAAAFLREFVGSTPWVHLDIAGTAYLENESAWQAKGPTGTPVRAFSRSSNRSRRTRHAYLEWTATRRRCNA